MRTAWANGERELKSDSGKEIEPLGLPGAVRSSAHLHLPEDGALSQDKLGESVYQTASYEHAGSLPQQTPAYVSRRSLHC